MHPRSAQNTPSNDASSEDSIPTQSVWMFMTQGTYYSIERRIKAVICRMIADGRICTCQHDQQFVQALEAMNQLQAIINYSNNLTFTMIRDLQTKTYQALNTLPPPAPTPPTLPDEADSDVVMATDPTPLAQVVDRVQREFCPTCEFYVNPINHKERCRPPRIAELQTEHASMSWTSCFEDECQIHLSEKVGANWYLQCRRCHRMRNSRQTSPVIVNGSGTIDPSLLNSKC
jgi:hypothetical protein